MIVNRQLIVLLTAVFATALPATAIAGPGGATSDAINVSGAVVRVGNPLLSARRTASRSPYGRQRCCVAARA